MKKFLVGVIMSTMGVLSTHAGALAETSVITRQGMQPVKFHGRMIQVHMMQMADGSSVYAMSRSDLEKLLHERIQEFSNYGPRR